METVILSNGVAMPKIGFGVYQIRDLEECERVVLEAIQSGYRLFDGLPIQEKKKLDNRYMNQCKNYKQII